MWKLDYRVFVSLTIFTAPIRLVRYRNKLWLRTRLGVWALPTLSRDIAATLFLISFLFVKHPSSHFLKLYAIISFITYYLWVRFLQTKSPPQQYYKKLQILWNFLFDLRYLKRLMDRGIYYVAGFAYICIIGIYLFYATKSILMTVGETSEPIPGITSQIWKDLVKTSPAGFVFYKRTELIHLQCLVDPTEYQKTFVNIPHRLGKYVSDVYHFNNKKFPPFFGRFTNDLEILKFLGNLDFQNFRLFTFFIFAFRTACRLWLPLFCGGYDRFLVWWDHPYEPTAFVNLTWHSRVYFSYFRRLICVLLPSSYDQICSQYFMEKIVFPLYDLIPSKFVLYCGGYALKYPPIYLPLEHFRLIGFSQKLTDLTFKYIVVPIVIVLRLVNYFILFPVLRLLGKFIVFPLASLLEHVFTFMMCSPLEVFNPFEAELLVTSLSFVAKNVG